MKRRDLIKGMTLIPFSGGVLTSKPVFAEQHLPKQDLFKELGVRTFINARGTITAMSGSLMHDYVLDAINSSSKDFCMLEELQDKVGERIAALVHSEAAMITAGAFSALTLGMAGVLTGMDLKRVEQLPHLESTGMKSEVIIQKKHQIDYNHALTNCGVKLVWVETPEDVDRAVNENTASMHFLGSGAVEGTIMHEEWLALAKKHNLPTSIDMAANVPPVSNLWAFNDMGFSFVALSGGKALRGPQSAGILMGKKEIIAAARLNAWPHSGTIGRGMKVNKEEMLGMYAALDKYINQDHDKEWKMWEDNIGFINDAVKKVKGVTTEITVPPIANHTPKLTITWDKNIIKTTRQDLGDKLRNGDPSIEVISWGDPDNNISLTVFMLKKGEHKIVAKRIQEELSKALA